MFLTDNEPEQGSQQEPEVPGAPLDTPAEPDSVEEFNQRNQGRDSDQDPSQDDVSQDPLDWWVDGAEAPANGREG